MFRAQPHPTIRSAPRISSAASGEEKPPETSSDQGLPWKRPLATADVATNAPQASASSSSACRHPGPRAPRPATNTGCSACVTARTSTSRPVPCAARAVRSGGCGATAGRPPGTSSTWRSRGRLSRTVRRSSRARATAAVASPTAASGEVIRTEVAPTERASDSWSTKKFDVGRVASAATTTSGVRLLAASAIPVMVLVRPQPWCTLTAATVPLIREYASAMVTAPPSCRAAVKVAPASTSALVTWKLPEPTTPNTCSTPAPASAPPTACATCISARPAPAPGPATRSRRRSAAGPRGASLRSPEGG